MKKFLKTRFLPLLGVLVLLISAVIVPVSAETTFDPYRYPTCNLMKPVDTFTNGNYYGVEIERSPDGVFTLNGVATSPLWIKVGSFTGAPSGTYYVSGYPLPPWSSFTLLVRPVGENRNYVTTIDVTDEQNEFEVILYSEANADASGVVIKPMINVGDTPYPYQPYLPSLFDAEYDEGYQFGENTGYAGGYEEGYQKGQEDLANAATDGLENVFQVKPSLTVEAYEGVLLDTYSNVPYTLTDGKISFSSIYDYLLSMADRPLSRYWGVNLYFDWEINTSVPEDLRLYPTISSSVLSVSSEIMPTGLRIIDSVSSPQVQYDYASAVLSDGAYHFNTSANEGAKFNQLGLFFVFSSDQDISILQSASIWSSSVVPSEVFQNGYVKGFYDGENQSFQEVKEEAYQDGEKVGFQDGYLTGKKEGLELAAKGDWRQLMIAVAEAPINTITSLFNFEILGMDMRLAFGSILAVCVLLIVIKKVIL